MKQLVEAGQLLEQIKTTQELWQKTLAVLSEHGFEFVIYNTVTKDFTDPFVLTNVPQIYAGGDPAQDPFLHYCCNSYATTATGPQYLPDYEYLSDKDKAFIKGAADSGFSTGLGIPMRLEGSHRFGGFNLGTRLSKADFETQVLPHSEDLRFFCLLVHRRIEELSDGKTPVLSGAFRDLLLAPENPELSGLSRREKEIIYLVARGLSRKECARLCSISPNTVAEYTKNAYRKLGVSNRVEVARLVFGQGSIAS